MSYRYKTGSQLDAYGDTDNVIHFKFGDVRKGCNFTDEFAEAHPRFCEEFNKYWVHDTTSLFSDPLSIVNYIEHYKLPIHLYSNMVDEEFADIEAAKEWICREYRGQHSDELYKYNSGNLGAFRYVGLDGEEA